MPLRENGLLASKLVSDFTPRPKSRTNFWLFEGRNLISPAEPTIVFGFWLKGSGRLGFVLLGPLLRPESEQNRVENGSK